MSKQNETPTEKNGDGELFPPMLWDQFMTHFYAMDDIIAAFRNVAHFYPDESHQGMSITFSLSLCLVIRD